MNGNNKVRNIKCYNSDSIAIADDEAISFFDIRNSGLISLLVHDISNQLYKINKKMKLTKWKKSLIFIIVKIFFT